MALPPPTPVQLAQMLLQTPIHVQVPQPPQPPLPLVILTAAEMAIPGVYETFTFLSTRETARDAADRCLHNLLQRRLRPIIYNEVVLRLQPNGYLSLRTDYVQIPKARRTCFDFVFSNPNYDVPLDSRGNRKCLSKFSIGESFELMRELAAGTVDIVMWPIGGYAMVEWTAHFAVADLTVV
ncbi:hypothetical protein BJ508DRAFT_310980 [Ascobolus immersus RN42]|uniref:Uncharacterized protein n=1 Tax=Ascobolus immersus RN42 TaxID=1160509 RepID=A0A3N4HVL9_ASCIM|nr:hypothetical protein BJ508DRAFT_310980 [Ascobolus immersus RN42]